MLLSDFIGLAGAAIVLVVYFLNLRGLMRAEGWPYALLNLIGAVLILVSLYNAWNLSAAIVELFWAAISIYGLVRAIRAKTGTQPRPR